MYISVRKRKNRFGELGLTLGLAETFRENGEIKNKATYVGTIIAEDLVAGDTRKLDRQVKMRLNEEQQAIFYKKLPDVVSRFNYLKEKVGEQDDI